MSKIYVTSDLHFGHNNIIQYENRPWSTVEEMDNGLIKNWNDKVTAEDIVYILGDFSFSGGERTYEIIKQLNGHKILIIGNHDHRWLKNEDCVKLFDEIVSYKSFRYKKQHIVMFHHPIACWAGMERGSIHLYGHIHSGSHNLPQGFNREQSYNVGVDTNNYELVDLDWILNIIEMRKEPEKYIPTNTCYCYKPTGVLKNENGDTIGFTTDRCPFWDKLVNKPEQENGVCHYLCTTDEELGLGLLWDQCKECGVNDYEDN